jgi:hypothetical protein
MSIGLSVDLSASYPLCLPVCLSVRLSIWSSAGLSDCLPEYVCQDVRLVICRSVCIPVCIFTYLPKCLSVCLSMRNILNGLRYHDAHHNDTKDNNTRYAIQDNNSRHNDYSATVCVVKLIIVAPNQVAYIIKYRQKKQVVHLFKLAAA